MSDTIGEAEEYELFGYPHTTLQDCDFLEHAFATFGRDVRRVLDIACGTGRHALEMARRGYSVTGIDISEDMLKAAGLKAAHEGLSIELIAQDMRDLAAVEAYDATYIMFNTIALLTENDDLIDFMDSAFDCLAPSGLFVVQTGNLWAYIAGGKLSNSVYNSEDEVAGVRRAQHTEIIIGPYNNLIGHRDQSRYWKDGLELPPKQEAFDARVFSVNEFDLLCRLTGFRILQVYGAADIHSQISDPNRITKVEQPHSDLVVVLGKVESTRELRGCDVLLNRGKGMTCSRARSTHSASSGLIL